VGNLSKIFCGFCVYFVMLLTIADYLLVIGTTLGLVFFEARICLREWILIGCCIVLILAQIRSFR